MKVPQPGDPAPALVGTTHLDESFDLSALRGRNVVIAFFPLAWTPV